MTRVHKTKSVLGAEHNFQIDVVAAAGAVHDAQGEGSEQARHHQRGRRAARGAVAHAGAPAAHAPRPPARLQHARGHHRDLRRLLAAGQRIFL